MAFSIQESFLYISLIISQSTHVHILTRKIICFIRKLFSNLVFGDNFAFNGIRWMYHDLFLVSVTKWHPPQLWRVRGRPSNSPWRSMRSGHSLTHSVESIKRLPSNGIFCSKHSRQKSFKFCYKMIRVLNLAKSYTRILPSLGYNGKLPKLQSYHARMWSNG